MSFWQWLATAGSNASSDPTINFAEGQAPSSLNDSCRAMMARLAEFRDDTSGSLVTGGTTTAYTLTTNQVLGTTPAQGQMIAFVPGQTNGLGVTLACDGGTSFPIQGIIGTNIAAGTLVSGTPYAVTLRGTAWILRGFYGNPFNMPLGGMMDYVGTTAPNSNFAIPVGQAISRTTFSTLFSLTSTTFGVGDGTTTFNLPDLRGRVVAQVDGGINRLTTATMSSNALGGVNNPALSAETVAITIAQLAQHSHTFSGDPHDHTFTYNTLTTDSGAGGATVYRLAGPGGSTQAVGATTVTGTNSQTGSGSAHPNVQPTICLNKILRII